MYPSVWSLRLFLTGASNLSTKIVFIPLHTECGITVPRVYRTSSKKTVQGTWKTFLFIETRTIKGFFFDRIKNINYIIQTLILTHVFVRLNCHSHWYISKNVGDFFINKFLEIFPRTSFKNLNFTVFSQWFGKGSEGPTKRLCRKENGQSVNGSRKTTWERRAVRAVTILLKPLSFSSVFGRKNILYVFGRQ